MAASRGLSLFVAITAAAAGAMLAFAPGAWAKDPPILVFPGRDAAAMVPEAGTISRIPPDPPPLSSRTQWVLDLRWEKGEVFLIAVHPLDLGTSQETSRAMGRFAVELFEGPTLIERVRFDFPMMGAGPVVQGAGRGPAPDLEKGLTSRIGVLFPAVGRGTRLELWDRATDRRWTLPWPIEEKTAAPTRAYDGGRDSGK